jgi:gamma-carbonic anhydrase
MHVPAGSVVMGSPAKIKRQVSEEERAGFLDSAAHYVQLMRRHTASLG